VLCSTPDKTAVVRNIESGAFELTLPAREYVITSVAVSPDSRHALCGDESGRAHYWDLDSGACLSTWQVSKPGSVDWIAFSVDGKAALTAGHGLVIRLWDLTARPIRKLREFEGHTLVVEGVGFGHDGRILFSVGRDQTLRMWDVETCLELSLPVQFTENCYALAVVRPDGEAVLAASGASVSLWDLTRSARHFGFASRVDDARSRLRSDPRDPAALATLGEWYAFRGADDWAVDVLEQARIGGAEVSSLVLARCYWQLDRMSEAQREFIRAMERKEAPADYLKLCRAAVTNAKTAAQPANVPAARPAQPAGPSSPQ